MGKEVSTPDTTNLLGTSEDLTPARPLLIRLIRLIRSIRDLRQVASTLCVDSCRHPQGSPPVRETSCHPLGKPTIKTDITH